MLCAPSSSKISSCTRSLRCPKRMLPVGTSGKSSARRRARALIQAGGTADRKNYKLRAPAGEAHGIYQADPISGLPISILDRTTAKRLLGDERVENVRYIPYKTIGKKAGVLPVVQIDKMCVYRDTECWTSQPLIGISEEELFAGGEYEMILNPNLF